MVITRRRRQAEETQQSVEGDRQRGGDQRLEESDREGEEINAEEGEAAAQPTNYVLGVPLVDTIGESFHCRLCAPIPKIFKRHGDLSKHLKRYHPNQIIVFKCNSCQTIFDTVKKCKTHQQKTPACRNAQAVPEDIPQRPLAAPGAAVVQRNFFQPRARRVENADHPQPIQRPVVPARQPPPQLQLSDHRRPVSVSSSSFTSADSEFIVDSVSDSQSTTSSQALEANRNVRGRPNRHPPVEPVQLQHLSTSSESVELGQNNARPLNHPHHSPSPVNIEDAEYPIHQIPPVIVPPKSEHQKRWIRFFEAVNDSNSFETNLDLLLAEVRQKAKINIEPQQRRPPRGNNRNQLPNHHGRRRNAMNVAQEPAFDPVAASRIQKLYRQSRPRAYREITEQSSPFCQIEGNDLFDYFSRVFEENAPIDPEMPAEIPRHRPPTQRNPLGPQFTQKEVWERLKRCSNTAPGPDGIRYSVWKKYDQGAHVLTSIYNCVKRTQHIPRNWTKSVTVLLHKKGDRNEVSNWRPIALSNTIGKLYSSVLANRLAMWSVAFNRAFERCRQGKRLKYEDVAEHYRLMGFDVLLEAFIVGPLGGWDPHNEFVLNKMKIGQHYRQLMRRLMVSDAIRWSRDIYVEHLTGVPQFRDNDDERARGEAPN
ncbi:hypothetical protein niasHS_018160 [Heterodera schachtii]|uniref:C2H2-type domain-containing protein n=1 Tax=Heterodera schachtii TaxID=97005 RepID=A0ABD2HXC7_HETSC